MVQLVDGHVDHVDHAVLLFGVALALPDVHPSDDDDELGDEEEGAGDDQAHSVDARAARQDVLFDEDFGERRRSVGVAVVEEAVVVAERVEVMRLMDVERAQVVVGQVVCVGLRLWGLVLVDDLDSLDDEHFLLSGVAATARQRVGAALAAAVRVGQTRFAAVVGDLALDGLAGRQTGSDQAAELHLVRGGELESVEVGDENFGAVDRLVDDAHDLVIGRTAALVDQQDLVVVDAVERHQVSHEDLVRAVLVDDLEAQVERIADLRRHHVGTVG